jgi:methylglyoxal synthase
MKPSAHSYCLIYLDVINTLALLQNKLEWKNMKTIALVAHDNKKKDIVEWCDFNKGTLARAQYYLYATGSTGKQIMDKTGLQINLLKSGPYGGDMELGALIANKKLDILIFFWDPLESQPHDVDVKAVLRMAVLYNIPTACNRATADMIISSPMFNTSS